jgi:hypothetical protein
MKMPKINISHEIYKTKGLWWIELNIV